MLPVTAGAPCPGPAAPLPVLWPRQAGAPKRPRDVALRHRWLQRTTCWMRCVCVFADSAVQSPTPHWSRSTPSGCEDLEGEGHVGSRTVSTAFLSLRVCLSAWPPRWEVDSTQGAFPQNGGTEATVPCGMPAGDVPYTKELKEPRAKFTCARA